MTDDYDPKAYWIWLQHALGAGSSKHRRILSGYRSLRDFYCAGREAWLLEGCFTQKEIRNLSSYTLPDAQALLEYCGKLGQTVLTPDCEEYPSLLREIHNPPCVLYVKGTLLDFDSSPSIAVVGTRKATSTGKTAARSLSYQLARQGVIIVSGGALGIDTAAHHGALQAGGRTVCVLGCGIDFNYLMANAALRDAIVEKGGALVSEFPPATQASGSNFPIRNRIISGLSLGTLVVEAAFRSGSLITADYALEQGRDVFAVPSGILSPVSVGVNNLIKCGAKPVSAAEDILEEYRSRFSGKFKLDDTKTNVIIEDNDEAEETGPQRVPSEKLPPDNLSADAQTVWGCLSDKPVHLARLQEETQFPTARLLTAVTELELSGSIRSHSGRRYSLTN